MMEDEIDRPAARARIGVLGGDGLWSVAEVLRAAGVEVADLEPAPKQAAEAVARKWHYGLASVRAGLLGHPRRILQLLQQVQGARPSGWVWTDQGLAIDGFRPEVDPEGMEPSAIQSYRLAHLAAVARLAHEVDRLILPLAVTKAWVDDRGTVFGAPRGDASGLREVQFSVEELRADLAAVLALLRGLNPGLVVQVAILPTLADQDALAAEMVLRQALDGALHDPVFDAMILRCKAGGSGASVLASLAQGQELDQAPAPVAAPVPDLDRDARRKARREKRKATGQGDAGKVVCEDELLEAFAK